MLLDIAEGVESIDLAKYDKVSKRLTLRFDVMLSLLSDLFPVQSEGYRRMRQM